jgi:hypothetical protein
MYTLIVTVEVDNKYYVSATKLDVSSLEEARKTSAAVDHVLNSMSGVYVQDLALIEGQRIELDE